ncbi:MAG: DUF4126 domain-containing protein [Anaerolineae bacterium]|nr:DUF4126 domain-containing protein [Anaerolineae bacterium]
MTGIFSAFGLSASAGLNAYIPLLIVALLAKFTNLLKLSEPWDALTSWWVIGVIIVLGVIEFFADKIPAVDHINDVIQTIFRPAAGAILFAAAANVVTEIHPVLSMVLGLLTAGSVHAVKSLAIRPAVTAATGGLGDAPVSLLEDATAAVVSVLAVVVPVVVTCLLIIATSLVVMRMYRRSKEKQAERRDSAHE